MKDGTKKALTSAVCAALCIFMAACGSSSAAAGEAAAAAEKEETAQESAVSTALSKIDSTKWLYNSEDNVYYQTGIYLSFWQEYHA